MSDFSIFLFPYVTEKTLFKMEKKMVRGKEVNENKIEMVVRREANKPQIKAAFEKMFDVKVEKVNTYIAPNGKHAVIKLRKDYSAEDVGMRMGLF